MGTDLIPYWFWVQRMDILAQNPDKAKEKMERLEAVERCCEKILIQKDCLMVKDLKINGKDLMDAGLERGKQIGEALNYLLDVVLEHPEMNEKEKLLAVCKRKYMLIP